MFKSLFIGLLVAIAAVSVPSVAKAQFGTAYQFPLVAGDTLTNVDTVFKSFTATAGYREVGIQALVNKVSGTVTGKVILLGSTDGRNYTPLDSATLTNSQTSSAYTPSYSNTAVLKTTGVPFTNYVILVTSSTTVSAPVRVLYTLRREQVKISN